MTTSRVHSGAAYLLLAAMILGGLATSANASEVTGTLSSDGSDTTATQSRDEAPIMNTGAEGRTLSGSVMGGLSDQNDGSPGLAYVTWSLAAVALFGAVAYLLWRRRA